MHTQIKSLCVSVLALLLASGCPTQQPQQSKPAIERVTQAMRDSCEHPDGQPITDVTISTNLIFFESVEAEGFTQLQAQQVAAARNEEDCDAIISQNDCIDFTCTELFLACRGHYNACAYAVIEYVYRNG